MDKYDEMIDRSQNASGWLAAAPRAASVGIDNGRLVIELTTGVVLVVPWSQAHLGKTIPASAEILGGGLDLYFPDLDEALFLPDLLAEIASHKQAA
jgi:hypothetical protein